MSKAIADLENRIDLLSLIEKTHRTKKVGTNLYRVTSCPSCNSEKGFTIYTDTNSYSSFCSCYSGGKAYKYLMEVEGMEEDQAYQELLSLSGSDTNVGSINKKEKSPITSQPTKAEVKEPLKNYTETILELYNEQTDKDKQYFINRGLSLEVIEKYKLSIGETKELNNKFYDRRAIIPIWQKEEVISYNARSLEDKPSIKYLKAPGQATPFNIDYIHTLAPNDTLIITEGEFDSLSLETIGVKSIAIGGVANYDKFMKELKRNDLNILTAFDNDESGQKVKSKHKINIPKKYNDINDWIIGDKENFSSSIKEQIQGINRPDNLFNYMNNNLRQDIESHSQFRDRKTGFKNLDQKTSLYPGLYVIGGVSTLGKTTFIHQLADQMAEQGEHIIFFSLEMATLELMTKSIARLSAIDDHGNYVRGKGVSSLDIRMADVKGKQSVVNKAIDDYASTSKRFNIIEGNFNTDINYIKNYTQGYIKRNKVKPIVIIDYLQIMPGDEQAWSDKDRLDRTVTGLKQLSRDFNITVIVVSSFNRSNYLAPVDFESFNGSGNIEYTADVVWGLQLQAIHEDIFDKNNNIKEKREKITKSKKAIPREIELVALKNRNGISNYSCNFLYYPQHDLFISQDKATEQSSNTMTRRL